MVVACITCIVLCGHLNTQVGQDLEHIRRQMTGGVFGTRRSDNEGQASGCTQEVLQLQWGWLDGCHTVVWGGVVRMLVPLLSFTVVINEGGKSEDGWECLCMLLFIYPATCMHSWHGKFLHHCARHLASPSENTSMERV
jgi:hypothetical protein